MIIVPKEKMVQLGLLQEDKQLRSLSHENAVTSYDSFADTVYQKICDLDGGTQKDVILYLQQDGWKIEDIQIALAILARQKRIAYYWG